MRAPCTLSWKYALLQVAPYTCLTAILSFPYLFIIFLLFLPFFYLYFVVVVAFDFFSFVFLNHLTPLPGVWWPIPALLPVPPLAATTHPSLSLYHPAATAAPCGCIPFSCRTALSTGHLFLPLSNKQLNWRTRSLFLAFLFLFLLLCSHCTWVSGVDRILQGGSALGIAGYRKYYYR